MDKEQRIAFLLSQVACFYAELEAMKAENFERRGKGLADAHHAEAFSELPVRFGLTHNQAISFLLGHQ